MLVKEKYANEIVEIAINGGTVAFNKTTNSICPCNNTKCSDCLFSFNSLCKEEARKFLNSEYVEKPLLSDDEYVILKNLDSKWKYIARDNVENNIFGLNVYTEKPPKKESYWSDDCIYVNLGIFKHLFQFIKWEDEEPYNIKKLIEDYETKKEVKDENN